MTIHLVETYEEDAHLVVAKHIASLLDDGQTTQLADTPGAKFTADCRALSDELRFDELAKKLAGNLDLVFSKSSEKDAECVLSVIVLLVSRLEHDQRLTELARKLALDIGRAPDVGGAAKLSALLALYGNAGTAPARYMVLLQTLEFAKQSQKLAAQLAPLVRGKADAWRRQWALKPAMAVDLYLQLAALFKVAGDKAAAKEHLQLLGAALALVGPQDAAELAKVQPAALEAVRAFLKAPDALQCDFFALPAVQQLAGDAGGGGAPALALLGAMLSGDLKQYQAAATPAALAAAGVDAAASLDKARLMALLVLAASAAGGELPFASIQAALDVPADQVQPWVVRAIGLKLLEARIDQVAETVSVGRCSQRTFGAREWGALQQQLRALREQLSAANDMLAAKAAGAAGGSAARPAGRPGAQAVH